ncbi:MAG: VWA domain-containing protein [bacterium]
MDVSKSMLAQDAQPDRLTRAKLAVTDFMSRLEGDRTGLIAFAGTAFLQCPLTLDYDAFLQSLDALDTQTIPKGGTNLAAAIKEAEEAMKTLSANHKILVLITDGEDLEGQGTAAAKEAAKNGLKIYTVGVGVSSGEIIPVPDASGGVQFVHDKQGNVVKSKLDEAGLRQLAKATEGFYTPLGQRGEGLDKVRAEVLRVSPKQELASKMQRVSLERFEWPLALGLVFLVLEFLIGDRKFLTQIKAALPRRINKGAAAVLSLVMMGTVSSQASVRKAERLYEQKKFSAATEEYGKEAAKKPNLSTLQFNLGAASYKDGQFSKAAEAFQKALNTNDVSLQQQAYYNLGNAQYRLGQQAEKESPPQTIQAWQQSVQSYEAALHLKPEDKDAKFNSELVKKKLDKLQKEQKEQQDQQEKNQQEQQNSSNQQNQQPSQEKQQSQSEQQEQKNSQDKKPEKGHNNQEEPRQAQSSEKKERQPSGAEQQADEAEARRQPGQMTKEEAKNLLDALKEEDAKPSTGELNRSSVPMDEVERDW